MKILRLISVVLTLMTALVSFSSERDRVFFKQGPLFYFGCYESDNVFATGPDWDYEDLVGYITVPGIVIHDGVEYTVEYFYAHNECAAPDSIFFSNRLVNALHLNNYSGLEYNKIYPDRMDTVEVESRPPYYSHTRIVDLPSGIKSIVDYGLDAHFIDTLICRADTPRRPPNSHSMVFTTIMLNTSSTKCSSHWNVKHLWCLFQIRRLTAGPRVGRCLSGLRRFR